MDPDEIGRQDFRMARRGYDPPAADAHVRQIAGTVGGSTSTPLADAAAGKITSIVEVAERKAAEIKVDACVEAERIVTTAREEAKERVERAQDADAVLRIGGRPGGSCSPATERASAAAGALLTSPNQSDGAPVDLPRC